MIKHTDTINNCEVMIDIETLGTEQGCPVLTIGACLFDPFTPVSSDKMAEQSIAIRIDVQEAVEWSNKQKITGGTIRWWLQQPAEALQALVTGQESGMKEALQKLYNFCIDRSPYLDKEFFPEFSNFPPASKFWAKDPDFDMKNLEFYYDKPQSKCKRPWKYYQTRSVRTIQDIAWPESKDDRPTFDVPGVAHDARWDAICQAMLVQAAYTKIRNKEDVVFKSFRS